MWSHHERLKFQKKSVIKSRCSLWRTMSNGHVCAMEIRTRTLYNLQGQALQPHFQTDKAFLNLKPPHTTSAPITYFPGKLEVDIGYIHEAFASAMNPMECRVQNVEKENQLQVVFEYKCWHGWEGRVGNTRQHSSGVMDSCRVAGLSPLAKHGPSAEPKLEMVTYPSSINMRERVRTLYARLTYTVTHNSSFIASGGLMLFFGNIWRSIWVMKDSIQRIWKESHSFTTRTVCILV